MDSGPAHATHRRASALSLPVIIGLIVVLLGGGVLAFFVWRGSQVRPTPVRDILSDLRTWDGQSVTIHGKVEAPTNLVLLKFYDINDGTGTIKVVTERGLPAAGSEIDVTGIVNQLYQVAGNEYTVILEPAGDAPKE